MITLFGCRALRDGLYLSIFQYFKRRQQYSLQRNTFNLDPQGHSIIESASRCNFRLKIPTATALRLQVVCIPQRLHNASHHIALLPSNHTPATPEPKPTPNPSPAPNMMQYSAAHVLGISTRTKTMLCCLNAR